MTTEKRFSQYLMANLPAHWFKMRVENTVAAGTPDFYLCINGRSIWVEGKAELLQPRLRPAQIAWATRLASAGGRVLTISRPRGFKTFYVWDWANLTNFDLVTDDKYVTINTPATWYGNFSGLIDYLETK